MASFHFQKPAREASSLVAVLVALRPTVNHVISTSFGHVIRFIEMVMLSDTLQRWF